jgi:serine/threonine protein phosphatase 1
VPETRIAWLGALRLMHVDAHRVYVHAGVDPKIPLDRQREATLLTKRYPKEFSQGFGKLHVVSWPR